MLEESVSIWASMNSWFTPTVLFVLLNVMIGTIVFASNLSTTTTTTKDPQQHHQHGGVGLARSPSMLQRLKSINLYHYRSPDPHTTTTTFENISDTTTHYAFQHTHEEMQIPQFTRSPSLLQRLKSINFHIPHDFISNSSPPTTAATTTTSTTTLHKTLEPELDQAAEHDQFEDEDDHFDVHEDQEDSPSSEEEDQQSLDEIFSQLKPLQDHHVNRTKSDTAPASGEVPTKLPKKMKKSASSKSAFGHFKEDDIVETRRPATVRERGVAKVADDDTEVDAKADDFINKFKQQLKLQRLDSIIRYKDMITRGK